ncbi:MAG: FHA domain-containing protein [Proteobacteria bacterium]|nr:FHA domain-containing protein [Pseudomonadota bacterium]
MKIQILKEGKLIKEYNIVKDSFNLGRSDECDIVVLEDGIARKHIEFKKSGKKSFSFVKKSKFGLLSKDGETVTQVTISAGENIEVGDITLSFVKGQDIEEKPIVQEEQDNLEQADVEEKKEKIPEKEKANNDFDFFTMSGNQEIPDVKKKEEEREKEKEKEKSKLVKKEETKKETKSELKKEEVPTAHGQPAVEILSKQDAGEATIVGSTYLLYQLIAISGPYKDKVFSLEKDVVIIGRAKNIDIVLIDDLVSREHTRLYKQGVDYYLIDLNSSNGTKVNGKKILEPVILGSGDIIEIGSSTLRFMVINPQAQNAHGVDAGLEDVHGGKAVIEKVAPIKSEGEIRKIEKSFGYKGEQPAKKKKLIPIAIGIFIVIIVIVFMLPSSKKEQPKKPEIQTQQIPPEEKKEEIPEVQCTEQGSFCQLPPGVQKQLLAEYDVGVKLFKNFQFELAEDRAQQILSKVPDWSKAKELLELAGTEKEKLLQQKREEEDVQVKKMLEAKLAKLVREAQELMRQEKYDKVKEVVSKIFEIDPNNQEAKKFIDKIEEINAQREKLAQKRAEFIAALSKYKNSFSEGKKFYDRKEYMKAIETFQRCLALPMLDSGDAKNVREDCKKLLDDSNKLLRESITPELTVAEELFTSGQFREAIASYQRVLKIDYKNKTAKTRIEEAKRSIDDDARESYSRAAIAESVSDFKNACLLYYKVVQIAIPGSKYYTDALSKTKKLCNKDRSGDLN